MSIYLIRHTTPLVAKGICYGWSDIDVTDSFFDEAAIIRRVLPEKIEHIYSSPLMRCRKLAEHLFPGHPVNWERDLQELNCGQWEMQHWDEIPRDVIDPWMKDFVNVIIPGGESYVQMHDRVTKCFEKIARSPRPSIAIAHGGVIRSILAHITGTALIDSFGSFKPHYGCVIKIEGDGSALRYEMLSNIATEREQHKPSSFYNRT